MLPGVIDQHPTHRPRRIRQEVLATAPRSPGFVENRQKRLVYECGGLQRVIRPFPAHAVSSEPSKLNLKHREDFLAGFPIASSELLQILCNVLRRVKRRSPVRHFSAVHAPSAETSLGAADKVSNVVYSRLEVAP